MAVSWSLFKGGSSAAPSPGCMGVSSHKHKSPLCYRHMSNVVLVPFVWG